MKGLREGFWDLCGVEGCRVRKDLGLRILGLRMFWGFRVQVL